MSLLCCAPKLCIVNVAPGGTGDFCAPLGRARVLCMLYFRASFYPLSPSARTRLFPHTTTRARSLWRSDPVQVQNFVLSGRNRSFVSPQASSVCLGGCFSGETLANSARCMLGVGSGARLTTGDKTMRRRHHPT